MINVQIRDHQILMLALIKSTAVKTYPERPDVTIKILHYQSGSPRGIEPAAEVTADGNIGPQADPDCILQQIQNLPADFLRSQIGLFGTLIQRNIPVFPEGDFAAGRLHIVARGQFIYVLENGSWSQGRPERENLVHRHRINPAGDIIVHKNRFDFRTENYGIIENRVIQRPNPDPVPRKEQLLFFRIPDRHGELAVQLLQAIRPMLLVKMEHHFSIGRSIETVTFLQQVLFQFRVVENFPVINDPEALVLIMDRLAAGGQIEA